MAMTSRKIRIMIRWMHIVLGLVIMCYIYSPFNQHIVFQWLLKLVVIPVITLSGIWIWKFKAVNRWLGIKN
jgi:hypothetical protein